MLMMLIKTSFEELNRSPPKSSESWFFASVSCKVDCVWARKKWNSPLTIIILHYHHLHLNHRRRQPRRRIGDDELSSCFWCCCWDQADNSSEIRLKQYLLPHFIGDNNILTNSRTVFINYISYCFFLSPSLFLSSWLFVLDNCFNFPVFWWCSECNAERTS